MASGAERHQLAALGAFWDLLGGIGRIGLIRPILTPALLDSGGGELLGEAAVFDEALLHADELLVEQVVGLVDQADHGVGDDGGVFVLEAGGVEF